MKRTISLLLVIVLCMSLCACQKTENPAPQQQTAEFKVGYGRVDITPKDLGAPIGGWGPTDLRLHTTVLDNLYASCVAVTGTNGETLLLMSVDLVNSYAHDTIRKDIEKELGIPYENIMWAATHTHSGPDTFHAKNANYMAQVYRDAVKAAKMALEDQAPATISIGTTEVEGLNFIRHYKMNDGSYAGANFGSWSSGIKGHAAENDASVQIIKFTRAAEDKKDIIMVNGQGHPLLTAGELIPDISADVVGSARMQVEYQTKAHFIFFLGASGDVNMGTRLPTGTRANQEDYNEFGKLLADGIIASLDSLEPAAAGDVRSYHQTYMGQVNRQMEDRLEDALKVQMYYNGEDRDYANQLALELGFSSMYHANGIVTRSQIPEDELPIELNVFSFGDISFVSAPYEMFAAHGMKIKEETPYKMTFVSTCSNGSIGYLPTEFAFEFGCYESHTTRFTGDTGTKCAETFIQMLQTMKAE